jgi:hypothetical protein
MSTALLVVWQDSGNDTSSSDLEVVRAIPKRVGENFVTCFRLACETAGEVEVIPPEAIPPDERNRDDEE